MSKVNALAGLIGNYGDSDEESDDGTSHSKLGSSGNKGLVMKSSSSMYSSDVSSASAYTTPDPSAAIHPAPIPHCAWSACYDENSGFTYYWNQQTNAVTWEAPPEYLLALKLAQQQLHTSGSTEVSAEEWQLYQQALAEKQNTQNKVISKNASVKSSKKSTSSSAQNSKAVKRRFSDDDVVKIELITSYHNSDSDSNDEPESPVKPAVKVNPPKTPKVQAKKPKKSSQSMEYGPPLPPNQNYTVPIGPELPPELVTENTTKPKDDKVVNTVHKEESKKLKLTENEDSQDENVLLTKLKDKAKLLEKLGGELPADLQRIIQEEATSKPTSPVVVDEKSNDTKSTIDTNIDDLLDEIEKKELPKIVKSKGKIDMFSEAKSSDNSPKLSPKQLDGSPPRDDVKALFPSSKNIKDEPIPVSSFPSAANIQDKIIEKDTKEVATEKKTGNVYLMDANETVEVSTKKKLRISNSVLPVKKSDTPSYTTKYCQSIDGITGERTGLGFSKDDEAESPKNTVSYGNGLMFTKGETLNEDKKDDDLDDLTELLEMKLKYLNQLQPCNLTPVQEMLIQMQTLVTAFRAGGLSREYWRRWALVAGAGLARHEAAAAPPGWRAAFLRYRRAHYRSRLPCPLLPPPPGPPRSRLPSLPTLSAPTSLSPPFATYPIRSFLALYTFHIYNVFFLISHNFKVIFYD